MFFVKYKKQIVMVLAAFLAVLMVLSIVVMALPAKAADVSEKSLNNLKSEQNRLMNDKKALQNELAGLQSQERSAIAEKSNLESQLSVLDEQITNAEMLISALDEEIANKEQEIVLAMEDEDDEYELFKRRVRAMEESSHVSPWAVLLGATSFSDFLARSEVVRDVIDYDNDLMDDLRGVRESIESLKAGLEDDRAFNASVKEELEAARDEATAKAAEVESLIKGLQEEQTYTSGEIEKLTKEINDCSKEIDRVAKELAKRKTYVGGDYLWPLPYPYYSNYITQGFKYRKHQITGVYGLHNGIDIGAPNGTTIFAANSGTVIQSGTNSAWGEYIMIDHGGGNVTLYAHMSKRLAKVNQEVKQGETIGYVGLTGYTTGYHLHFTIYVNGTAVDPMKYFK